MKTTWMLERPKKTQRYMQSMETLQVVRRHTITHRLTATHMWIYVHIRISLDSLERPLL